MPNMVGRRKSVGKSPKAHWANWEMPIQKTVGISVGKSRQPLPSTTNCKEMPTKKARKFLQFCPHKNQWAFSEMPTKKSVGISAQNQWANLAIPVRQSKLFATGRPPAAWFSKLSNLRFVHIQNFLSLRRNLPAIELAYVSGLAAAAHSQPGKAQRCGLSPE